MVNRRLISKAAFVIAAMMLSMSAMAQYPTSMHYQGRLLDSGGLPVPDGSYTADFAIYNAPVGGFTLWTEPGLSITTEDGLFNVELGLTSPMSPGLFLGVTELYLEIVVASETITPRTHMASNMFAHSAMGLNVPSIYGPGPGINTPYAHQLSTWGSDGLEQFRVWGESYGEIYLYDGDVSNDLTVILTANFSSGGALLLNDNNGFGSIRLHGGLTGDGSVLFSADAINDVEILNEPGIASFSTGTSSFLTTTMSDLDTVTMTIPTDGFITLSGKLTMRCSGTTGINIGYVQIDETAGGTWSTHAQLFGLSAYSSTGECYFPTSVIRTYAKTAGTYTFRLEAMSYVGNTPGALTGGYFPTLTAVFYPTSYGTVSAIAASSELGEFENYSEEPVGAVASDVLRISEPMYRVDLTELERKAKEARATAIAAENELQKARIELAKSAKNQQALRPESTQQ